MGLIFLLEKILNNMGNNIKIYKFNKNSNLLYNKIDNYENNDTKKISMILTIFILSTSFCLYVNAIDNNLLIKNSYHSSLSYDYIEINVEEAWNLLNDTSNGI